jgi:hypothetical protein
MVIIITPSIKVSQPLTMIASFGQLFPVAISFERFFSPQIRFYLLRLGNDFLPFLDLNPPEGTPRGKPLPPVGQVEDHLQATLAVGGGGRVEDPSSRIDSGQAVLGPGIGQQGREAVMAGLETASVQDEVARRQRAAGQHGQRHCQDAHGVKSRAWV